MFFCCSPHKGIRITNKNKLKNQIKMKQNQLWTQKIYVKPKINLTEPDRNLL